MIKIGKNIEVTGLENLPTSNALEIMQKLYNISSEIEQFQPYTPAVTKEEFDAIKGEVMEKYIAGLEENFSEPETPKSEPEVNPNRGKRGFTLYNILDFISKDKEGKSYSEIIEFVYKFNYGENAKFDKKINRGYYSTFFSYRYNGSGERYLNKGNGRNGKYTLNYEGRLLLNKYKEKFGEI